MFKVSNSHEKIDTGFDRSLRSFQDVLLLYDLTTCAMMFYRQCHHSSVGLPLNLHTFEVSSIMLPKSNLFVLIAFLALAASARPTTGDPKLIATVGAPDTATADAALPYVTPGVVDAPSMELELASAASSTSNSLSAEAPAPLTSLPELFLHWTPAKVNDVYESKEFLAHKVSILQDRYDSLKLQLSAGKQHSSKEIYQGIA